MSTPTPARDAVQAAHAVVPQPRSPADPPVDASAGQRSSNRQAGATEPVGVFGRYPWLVPVLGVACVIAVFLAMVLLNWAAGGGTMFDR